MSKSTKFVFIFAFIIFITTHTFATTSTCSFDSLKIAENSLDGFAKRFDDSSWNALEVVDMKIGKCPENWTSDIMGIESNHGLFSVQCGIQLVVKNDVSMLTLARSLYATKLHYESYTNTNSTIAVPVCGIYED